MTLPLLRDERDRPLFRLAVRALGLLPIGVAVFVLPRFEPRLFWPLAVAFVVFYGLHLQQFITMFHDVNHRPLFRSPLLNAGIHYVLGPLYGSTPNTYFAHHLLMHHPANNLAADASTTLPYQRDSIVDFARYYLLFFVGLVPLCRYLGARYPRRLRLPVQVAVGELGWWALVAVAAWVEPWAAAVVFGTPLLVTRSLLIIGNWAEHAFIDLDDPANPYRNSCNLVGERVNQRSFNVGYHIDHHLRPSAHFSTHPEHFEAQRERFGAEGAVVLEGLTYPDLWFLLMTRNHRAIAARWVALPGAPERTPDEVVALLKARVARGTV